MIGQADEDTGSRSAPSSPSRASLEGAEEMVGRDARARRRADAQLARPKRIVWADDLPKTRSRRIMRRLLRDIAEGRELGDVTTLRDPDVVRELDEMVKRRASGGEEEYEDCSGASPGCRLRLDGAGRGLASTGPPTPVSAGCAGAARGRGTGDRERRDRRAEQIGGPVSPGVRGARARAGPRRPRSS